MAKVEDAAAEIDENKDARAGNKVAGKKVQFKQEKGSGEKVIKGRFNRQIAAEKEARKQKAAESAKPNLLGKRKREDEKPHDGPSTKRPKKF